MLIFEVFIFLYTEQKISQFETDEFDLKFQLHKRNIHINAIITAKKFFLLHIQNNFFCRAISPFQIKKLTEQQSFHIMKRKTSFILKYKILLVSRKEYLQKHKHLNQYKINCGFRFQTRKNTLNYTSLLTQRCHFKKNKTEAI